MKIQMNPFHWAAQHMMHTENVTVGNAQSYGVELFASEHQHLELEPYLL